jgi:hypothetical protein
VEASYYTEAREVASPKKVAKSLASQHKNRFNERDEADYKEQAKAHIDRTKYPLDHRKRALTGVLLSGNHGSLKN